MKKTIGLLWLCAVALVSAERINANDLRIRYSGRVDFSDPAAPGMIWPGTSVRARFEGTQLTVELNDELGKNHYNVIIDGQDADPFVLATKKGTQSYVIATNLSVGVHDLLLFRRSEGHTGITFFQGLETDGRFLDAPPAPSRRIEFYGDSITCGMGIEAPEDYHDKELIHRNNYLTYAAITARNLNAEYHCIARSGIGIIKSWNHSIMPDYYDRLDARDPPQPSERWEFSTWVPDVVVINLFQNDSWLTSRMEPPPTVDEIIAAYIDFVEKIRCEYPHAYIVCALGPMDATREGSPWPGYIEQAVTRMNDEKISTCFFAHTISKHPRVKHHREMAEKLTAHIRNVMGWSE